MFFVLFLLYRLRFLITVVGGGGDEEEEQGLDGNW
jgi:hypothetical protein